MAWESFEAMTKTLHELLGTRGYVFQEMKWSEKDVIRRWTGDGEHVELRYDDDRPDA